MTLRVSKLFGMEIYSTSAEHKGKIYDLVINLEKGRLETITTEVLKARTKQEAKKIIMEKSIPYRNVKAVQDIVLVSNTASSSDEDSDAPPIVHRPKTHPGHAEHYRRKRF
ncbi:MAG: PRC-barrel domain-containing protein [Candidatus Diapherotrites archaeon]